MASTVEKPKIDYGMSDAERRSRRFALLIAGIFLVPLAAIICGCCGCFVGLLTDPLFSWVPDIYLAIGGVILGVIGGIVFSVYLLGERWRELK